MDYTINQLERLTEHQTLALFNLWNNEYPATLRYQRIEDFELYLRRLENVRHYLLTGTDGRCYGWAFDFDRTNARWFGIIIDSCVQRQNYGSALLQELKKNNQSLNGWMIDHNNYLKTDGSLYQSPAAFYKKQQFTLHPDEHIGLEILSAIKISWRAGN